MPLSDSESTKTGPGINYSMPAPEGFNFDKPDQWPCWIRRFDRYREASGLAQQKDEKQIDTLIYSMGDKAEDILATFTLSEADSKKYPKVKAKFETHFIAKRNIICERAKFNSRKQGEKEPIESFITDLFALAEHCQYGALHDELIRDKIVVACRDGKLSEKLQLDPELTLDKAIRQARSSEAVKSQQEVVRNLNEEAAVHVINKRPQQRRRNKEKNTVKDSELFKKSATGQDARQNKAYRPNAHLLYIVMHYNGNVMVIMVLYNFTLLFQPLEQTLITQNPNLCGTTI